MDILHRGSPEYRSLDSPPYRDYDRRRPDRSASPFYDGANVKRKRSISPPDRRYVRARFNDNGYSDHNRYSNDRPRSPGRRRSTLEDPMQRDSLASFKQYSDWLRSTRPELWHEDQTEESSEKTSQDKGSASIVKARYDEYRRQFIRKQHKLMFDYHRNFTWFKEKYDTGERYADMRDRVRKYGWEGAIDFFVNELEAGKYDPTTLSVHDPIQSISAGNDDRREDVDHDGDDSMQGGISIPVSAPPTQTLAPGEAMVIPRHPQLMIKTLPPDIGRLKLEEVLSTFSGFKYVAMGDPVQKKQFYRPAWIAFEDNNDVSKAQTELETKKVDNFRLPVAVTSDPYIAKIRYTPAIANKLSRMEKDLEQAKRLAAVLETQAAELASYKPSYPIGTPLNAVPITSEGTGENDGAMTEDIDHARGTKAVEERIDKIASETIDTDENGKPDYAKKVALSLDLYLAYLREAFHCCYYCVAVTDHQEELARKCIKHERREEPVAAEAVNNETTKASGSEFDERWADNLDNKIACLIDPTSVDPSQYGGTNLEEERSRVTSAHFQQEEEGKWRCQVCKKLFKATEFVEKHIINKHPELVKAELDEWEMYNNFVLDPQHIPPLQSVPSLTSGTMQHPPQAFGLPPDWRSPYAGDSSRFSRDARDNRDRRMGYRNAPPRRSPSPVQFSQPIRFTMDGNNPSIPWTPGSLPAVPGLPAKPVAAAMAAAPPPQVNPVSLLGRISAPLPPPPGVKPDPRSRISYHDLDRVESTDDDVALQY
ncbi:hypothetical protein FRC17_007179 [Serendipita sp. 399]|nr:hypothetical protein FRC17_007179 [Serendipita sp. 399]